MRNGAGTKNKILTTLPYKANVRCYGYYSTVSGVAWPCVEYINKDTGTKYTGFVSSAFLN